MAGEQKTREQEQRRLTAVLVEVREQLNKIVSDVDEYRKQAVETRKLLWDEYARYIYEMDNAFEIQPQLAELDRREKQEQFYRRLFDKLERIWERPYFGRMDFKSESWSGQTDCFYIGLAALTADVTGEALIYDWRAPASGMYYDFETGGQACYQCPDGEVRGKIELKRQFKIENQQLRYFFDSSLQIDDEMLQEVLGHNVGERMKTIVTSIQREQNQAIRDDVHRVLIVSGPAGCGKTSIALHRAAYLLYKMRATLRAENILIFSPNSLFSDYIAGVLPQLGEENICQTTFQDYLASFLPSGLTFESRDQYLEWLYSCPEPEDKHLRLANYQFKSSPEFLNLLNQYVDYLEELHTFTDLFYEGNLIMAKTEAEELFRNTLRYLPLGKRLQQIKKRVLFLIEPFRRQRVKEVERELEKSDLKLFPKELRAQARLTVHQEFEAWIKPYEPGWELEPLECYRQLFNHPKGFVEIFEALALPGEIGDIRQQTRESLSSGQLRYEDIYPVLYLQGKIMGFPKIRKIKHLIIDEAQDYQVIQYRLVQEMFPDSAMTILGDLNQTLYPINNIPGFECVAGLFYGSSCKSVHLERSYRSTRQINQFNQSLLGEIATQGSCGIREGERPILIELNKPEELVDCMVSQVRRLNSEGLETVAIICKTESVSRKVYAEIQPWLSVQLFSGESETFSKGNVVLPVYLAKGLEFDAVIVYQTNTDDYPGDAERRILYTACSRALHRLVMVYTGNRSPLLTGTPPAFYTFSMG